MSELSETENPSTELDGLRSPDGKLKPGAVLNPDGKGGFGDNPQNRHNGAWKKTETFRYWFDVFKEMSVTELREWLDNNPEDTRSVASNLAYQRVTKALNDIKEFQEVANRSEGMPKQSIKHEGDLTISMQMERNRTAVDRILEDYEQGDNTDPATN